MIKIEDTADLINKGKATFDTCYPCDFCEPISHKCLQTEPKKIEFIYDRDRRLRFKCNKFTDKRRSNDPNAW
jgi:hypothetical protein